jgi:histidinol-phosphate aminotransferase
MPHQDQNQPKELLMNTLSISRRKFARLLGVGAAAAIVRPRITIAKESATVPAPAKTGVVRLSANENPYGPSAKAHEAMKNAHGVCNRYPDEANDVLIDRIAKINNVNREQIVLGDGSSEILKLCAETFTGPTQGKLIAADPTFEAILEYSKACGGEVVKVPLTSSFAHDLEKMGAAANGKGLIYICNPNNPTASITPKSDLREFIAKTSPETMILVDEAYFHYADSPDYESVIPLVKDHPNLIVARTFSKIYGMAGLRCGYCVAQPETIKPIHGFQMWDSVNIMALASASASLDDEAQVTNGRKMNSEAKSYTLTELEKMGHKSIPSQANFIMFDCKKPVVPIIKAMKDKNVAVGRLFPAYPNHMRLTIGKKSEMESFVSAFKQVMAA